jgi:hypothetical protein
MFEIGVFCVILFALGYWATLFIMGRREDVLHGEFVEPEPELAAGAAPAAAPIFPPKPAIAPRPAPVAAMAPPPPASAPEKPANAEALQSLLVSIKQELKNAAQI